MRGEKQDPQLIGTHIMKVELKYEYLEWVYCRMYFIITHL